MATENKYHPITVLTNACDFMTQYRADLRDEYPKYVAAHPPTPPDYDEDDLEETRTREVAFGLGELLRAYKKDLENTKGGIDMFLPFIPEGPKKGQSEERY